MLITTCFRPVLTAIIGCIPIVKVTAVLHSCPYVTVALPDYGRIYRPKHVVVNVMNKWIYTHL